MSHQRMVFAAALAAVTVLARADAATPEKHARKPKTRTQAKHGPGPLHRLSETTEGRSGEGDRWSEWFYGQRSYPSGSIPRGARGKALDHAKHVNAHGTASRSSLAPLAPPPSWIALGPSQLPKGQTDSTAPGAPIPNGFEAGAVSGRVSAIALDPTDPDVVYVGGAQGGVWKTTNATSPTPTFTPLTDDQPSLAIGDIAVDPVDTRIVYVGTGEANGGCDSYYGRGILRSTDAGATWANFGADLFSGNVVTRVVVDPASAGSTTSTTVWATVALGFISSGTEQCDFAFGAINGGIYRSTDSGETWTKQDTAHFPGVGARTYDMVLDPTDSNVVYVTVRAPFGGIWKSTNGNDPAGATFTLLSGGLPTFAIASPPPRRVNLGIGMGDAHGTLYASISDFNSDLFGVYKTTDAGATWAHLDAGRHGIATVANNTLTRQSGPPFDPSMVGRRVIIAGSIARTITKVINKQTARIGGANLNPAGKVSYSVGSYPDFCPHQCGYDMTVGVDSTDASRVFIGGNPHTFNADLANVPGAHSVWRTEDGGSTWASVSEGADKLGGIHGDDHEIVFDAAGNLWDGNDGGLWRSTDHGASWTNLNTNLAITQFQGLALHPTDPNIILGGTQDNGTNILGSGLVAPPKWFHTDFGDGGLSLIDQSNPATMLHTYFNQASAFYGPARSDIGGIDGSGGWAFVGTYFGYGPSCYNGLDPTDDVSFYAAIAQNTAFSPNVFYLGSDKIYRSPNPQPNSHIVGGNVVCTGAVSWTAVSPVLTKGGRGSGQVISAIAALPSLVGGKDVVYAGTSDGRVAVSSSIDGSGVAAWSVLDGGPFPNRWVTEIEVDGSDPTGNTAYVAVSGFGTGHIWRVTNALTTPEWTDLSGDLPDIPVNCLALAPEGVYVGTDIGVFLADGLGHWELLSNGFPTVAVFGLDRNPGTGILVAATHGRGMFRLSSAP